MLAAAALTLMPACSTTARIADDEQLYNGIKKLELNPQPGQKLPEGLKSEISEAVTVKPNNPYPFTNIRSFWPFGLWVYNHFPNPPKGFKHWFYENSRPNRCSYPTSAPTFAHA